MTGTRRRRAASVSGRPRRDVVGGVIIGVCVLALAGCAGTHLKAASGEAAPPSAPSTHSAPAPAGGGQGPAFPSPRPDMTPDPAAIAAADARLATADLPEGAVSHAVRPEGVASALAIGFWCQPMADETRYWTVPNMSSDSVVDYLKAHPPHGLTLAAVTGSNAAGDPRVQAQLVEYAASMDAQDGLIYEVTTLGTSTGVRADALVVPSNTTCATAPPGTAMGSWGG